MSEVKVVFRRGDASYISGVPIRDGQVLMDTTNKLTKLDVDNERIDLGGIDELARQKIHYAEQDIEELQEEMQEVFTSVSNGKDLVASAITDKGVPTESDATFQQMADNIEQIQSGGSFDILNNIAVARDEIIKPLLLNYNCVDIASGTTLTCNLTSNVDGWCLATVTTRSDTTYPSGWTLLKEIHINDSTDQRMAMLCKQVQENEEITFTAIQSNSARIYINLLVLDCNGFEANNGTEIVKKNADSTQNIVSKIYDKCVWCCSAVNWSSYYYWNIDGLVSIGIQPSNSPRQCNIIDFLDVNSRTIKGGSNNTAFIIDSVKIL